MLFARLAGGRGLLSEEQVELLFGLKALDRMAGLRRTVADLSVAEGLLPAAKVDELRRSVRYYLVRQADREYGRLAAERGLVPRALVDGLLEDQRRAFQ